MTRNKFTGLRIPISGKSMMRCTRKAGVCTFSNHTLCRMSKLSTMLSGEEGIWVKRRITQVHTTNTTASMTTSGRINGDYRHCNHTLLTGKFCITQCGDPEIAMSSKFMVPASLNSRKNMTSCGRKVGDSTFCNLM